jgi:hypothetical protein
MFPVAALSSSNSSTLTPLSAPIISLRFDEMIFPFSVITIVPLNTVSSPASSFRTDE